MHILFSSIESIKLRIAYKKQKRTALHMLAVSGVVRPSHVELRYMTPLTGMTGFRTQPTSTGDPQTHPMPLPSWSQDTLLNVKQTQHRACALSSAIIQLIKKPILLRWTKQVGL
jgi:hypothetical protein